MQNNFKYSKDKTEKTFLKKRKEYQKNSNIINNDDIRLNKAIADSGFCSRRKADELIESGVVKVNNKTVLELGAKVKFNDKITINGNSITSHTKKVYIVLNKPKDIITTTKDERDRDTVLDIVKTHTRVFPVGRLDRNSTGVLLLTNDGELSYRLTHPKYEVKKVYNVTIDKPLANEDAIQISNGIELDDGITSPCEILIDSKEATKITIILNEGKNREIRRIFEKLGYKVKKLDRKYFANLSNSGLARGQYRHLSNKEVIELKKMVGL